MMFPFLGDVSLCSIMTEGGGNLQISCHTEA
jgi:hypothetical protein